MDSKMAELDDFDYSDDSDAFFASDEVRDVGTFFASDEVRRIEQLHLEDHDLPPLLVCGIDIGLSSSCCFFLFRHEYMTDRRKLSSFLATSGELLSDKHSSSVLLDDNLACISIGGKADDMYAELVLEEGNPDKYFMFQKLKGNLYDKMSFKKSAVFKATNGKEIKAKVVFTSVLSFLKKEAEKALQCGTRGILDHEIKWILPVPVVWNNVALEFMQDAAEKAGMLPSNFLLVKESDAAVLCCLQDGITRQHSLREPGTKFMVLDSGGSKTDITIFQVNFSSEFGLHEIFKINVMGLGFSFIVEKLWEVFEHILGKSEIEGFREKQNSESKELQRELELKLERFHSNTRNFRFRLPLEMQKLFRNSNRTTKYQEKIHQGGDKMEIEGQVILDMFDELMTKIEHEIDKVLSKKKLADIDIVIAVGGLACSPILKNLLSKKFRACLVPDSPQYAVVRGSLLHGHDPSLLKVIRESKEHIIVASIDFGTTFSGYAFSTYSQFQEKPLDISTYLWEHESGCSQKTLTCVLFYPDGKLHSVGYDAEEKYCDLASDENQTEYKKWFFFRRFKMQLYQRKIFDRDFVLYDEYGKPMDALVVFAAVIRYLKEHLKNEFDKSLDGLLDSDIKWVLTVPAIWSDSSKQFMREAAEKADIDSHKLSLALEPEAASDYCRKAPIERIEGEVVSMSANTEYLVLDCGGGTVDITVNKIIDDVRSKELFKANGGNWGGTAVDDAFWSFMTEVLGKKVIETFRRNDKYYAMQMETKFEGKKKKVFADSTEDFVLYIPHTLIERVKQILGCSIQKVFESNERFKTKVKMRNDKMKISAELMKSFFDTSCASIVGHLKNLFKLKVLGGVNTILMVGGFSESPILQHTIKTNFPDKRVIVPYNAGLAVLKGAVLFGHHRGSIHSRVCRYTYGIETNMPFEEEMDKLEYAFTDTKGRLMCRRRFKVFVQEGTDVSMNAVAAREMIEVECVNQFHITLPIYSSDEGCPRYTSECSKIGDVRINVNDVRKESFRTFQVEMSFGYTETTVKVTDVMTGKFVTAKLDFLE